MYNNSVALCCNVIFTKIENETIKHKRRDNKKEKSENMSVTAFYSLRTSRDCNDTTKCKLKRCLAEHKQDVYKRQG